MANLVMTAADGSGGVWQDPVQLIPMGMNADPAGFVAKLKASLPLVNNLRILFNEHSFNADGSLHPQMEAFFAAAVAQGYDLTICYGEGDAQNIGIGEGRWPKLTNAAAYAALQANHADVAGAWTKMMDWMDDHAAVKAGVTGWELMNESAAYRHSFRFNRTSDGLGQSDFVKLYANHAVALADLIDARADGRILVGGWGYNGDFLTLAQTRIAGGSAIDYIRAGVGSDLIWSGHFYPGWLGTSDATTPAQLIARLQEAYAPVAGDAVLITEINVDGRVDDTAGGLSEGDFVAASLEWFAQKGMGLGWYPAVQTGGSGLLYMDWNGGVTTRHQHSLAHALNGFSLSQAPASGAGNQAITASVTTIRARNESYEIAAGEANFDTGTVGYAFGFGGEDTLTGTDRSNDMAYGGVGHDILRGLGGDDFLFGQSGNDGLFGGAAIDNLFGGLGQDTLDGGSAGDFMAGGAGDDRYIVDNLKDKVQELAGHGTDTVQTGLARYVLGADVEHLIYKGGGRFTGTGNALNNQITGGARADTLSGASGKDILAGGKGNDLLTGGRDADRFIFAKNGDVDRITDFRNDVDTIVLQGFAGVRTVAQALSHADRIGDDVRFDFGSGDRLWVLDTTLNALKNDLSILG